GLVIPLLALLGLNGDFRRVLAFDENDVAGAAFDHLALDRFHPDATGRAVFADAVQEDAAIASGVLAWRPGLLAPFELGNQVIVVGLGVSDEAAEDLPGDMDHAIVHGEDFFRIVVLALAAKPGVEAGQVLAIEELGNAVFVIGAGLISPSQQERGEDRKK